MATIKGQNLRLFLDGQVIAAAQSCTLHVAVNMADCSSKDNADNWQRQLPVGLSWDVSADALVCTDDYGKHYDEQECDETKRIKGTDYAYCSDSITVEPGQCLKVTAELGHPVIINGTLDAVLASGSEYAEWVNNTDTNVYVYLGSSDQGDTLYATLSDGLTHLEHFEHMIAQKEPIRVQFAEATAIHTVGTWTGYEGEALITDISVNTPNRALSTYTIQLTGTGRLARATE